VRAGMVPNQTAPGPPESCRGDPYSAISVERGTKPRPRRSYAVQAGAAWLSEAIGTMGSARRVDVDTLTQHARRLIEQQIAAAAIGKLKTRLSKEAAKTPAPPDLRKSVEQRLAEEPQLPWDAALAELLRSES
jgi:hypothetical protein